MRISYRMEYEMNKIRFGIVGCGLIAGIHARAIDSITNAELAGVTDVSRKHAEGFTQRHGGIVYGDYKSMLADQTIDAVCICTPSGMHAKQALHALRAGKHVVLEKPMALNSADALQICREAEKNNCLLTVISQHRFHSDITRVRQLIREGKFGQLLFCDLYMKYWRDPAYYSSSNWKGTFCMDGGGALMNQGIHGVDLICFLVGKPKLLCGRAKTLFHDIEVEDTATAMLEFDCGALGVIEASTAAIPGFSKRIEIQGTKGYAILVDSTLEKLCIEGNVLIDRTLTPDAGTASDPTQLGCEGHILQITNFINAVLGKEALISTAEDGYHAVNLIEEIYKSSARIMY